MRYTSVPPAQLIPWLIGAITASGCTVTSQSPSAITGEYRVNTEPNPWIAILLFFLFVVPFIIYLMTSSKGHTHGFSITVQPSGTGSAIGLTADTYVVHVLKGIIDSLPV